MAMAKKRNCIFYDEENLLYDHFSTTNTLKNGTKRQKSTRGILQEVNVNKRIKSRGNKPLKKIENVGEEIFSSTYIPPEFDLKEFDINHLGGEDFTHYNEYVTEMYRYLFSLEKHHRVDADFMDIQTEVNSKMRSIVVDWLVQVQNRFRMMPETLQLTVRIMDYYVSQVVLRRRELQLVAIAAMLIASKYEEMVYPEIRDFVYVTKEAYGEDEIRDMETKILLKFNFFVGFPIPLQFLRRFSKAIGATSRVHKMARYFLEIALLDAKLAVLLPSLLASSALNLAAKLLKECKWNERAKYHSTYEEHELDPYVAKIALIIKENETSTLRSTFKKYADKHNECISIHKIFDSTTFKEITGNL